MRAMKDSGIPWIGEIPEGWNIELIGNQVKEVDNPNTNGEEDNALQFKMGSIISKSQGNSKYNPETLEGYNIVDKGVIMLNGLNLSFDFISQRVGLVRERGVITSTYLAVKPTDNIDSEYLTYLFKAYDNCKAFHSMGKGLRQTLSYGELRKYLLIYPSLAEQQRIAEFLDRKCAEVDEMIALQEQIIEELKAYKQSVITEAVTKGLNPNVPMRDSGIEWIGQIPEHWGVCRVKDCLQNTKNNLRVGPFGSALSGNDICDIGEYWIYNQRTVLDSNFSTNNSFVTKEKYYELESFKVFPNDILITTRGSIGKIAIVPSNAPVGILHPCIIRFVIDKSKYNSRLLKRIFNESDFVLKQLRYQSNSTTIEVIYSYTLRNITLPNIPIAEQQAIADYLDEKCANIDALIATKQQKIDSLKEYKKSIIYEYVTGKKEIA